MLGKQFRLLFGVSLLSMSAASEALTIQSGSSVYHFNTNSPKIAVYRSEPESIEGPYIGVNFGYAKQMGSDSAVLPQFGGDYVAYAPDRLHGLFEQLNVGYVFNPYFSVEVGGMHFANGTYKVSSYGNPNKIPLNATVNTTVKTYAADVLLKGTLPIESSGFSLMAGGGVAYERVSFATSSYARFPNSNDGLTTSTTNMGFVPMLTTGIAYAVSTHISLLANYDYIFEQGTIAKNYLNYFPGAHIVTAGLMIIF